MADPSQATVPFPLLNSPFVENGGFLAKPWHRFLISLWQRSGGAAPIIADVILKQTGIDTLTAYDSTTGDVIGVVPLEDVPGGPVQVVAITGSPQIYHSANDGVLVVFSAAVEMSRDGITWYQASLQGGAFPLKTGDRVRATWFNPATPPTITWFPTYT